MHKRKNNIKMVKALTLARRFGQSDSNEHGSRSMRNEFANSSEISSRQISVLF